MPGAIEERHQPALVWKCQTWLDHIEQMSGIHGHGLQRENRRNISASVQPIVQAAAARSSEAKQLTPYAAEIRSRVPEKYIAILNKKAGS